ncbi:MAG: hypothetical protein AABX30_00295 [Nanoarchaeota archaeon]
MGGGIGNSERRVEELIEKAEERLSDPSLEGFVTEINGLTLNGLKIIEDHFTQKEEYQVLGVIRLSAEYSETKYAIHIKRTNY